MATNFAGGLLWSIPISFGKKNDFGWLKVPKVENGLGFSDFTNIAYYINFGGHAPVQHWAWRPLPPISRLGVPIGTTKKIFPLIGALLVFSAHPSTYGYPKFIYGGSDLGGLIHFW